MSIVRSAAVAVTVAAVLLVLHPGVRDQPEVYDEGNTVYTAWRVAEGEVLYRDLWTIHAPGMPHLLALIFAAFGPSIVAERALKLSLLGLLSALGYACFRRFSGALAAAVSVALALCTQLDPKLVSVDPALVALLAALVATTSAIGRGAPPVRLFLAGLLLGLTVWFRQDFGVYATVACTITVALASRLESREGGPARWVAGALAALWSGAAVPVLAMAVYFFVRGALPSMVRQMIVFPLTTFAAVRELPAPALLDVASGLPFGLMFWLIPPTLLAGAALAGRDLWRGAPEAAALLAVSLSGLFVFNYARVRADVIHVWPALVMAIPVWIALGTRAWRWPVEHNRRLFRIVGGLLLAGAGGFGAHVVQAPYQVLTATRPTRLLDTVPAKLPGAAGVRVDPVLEEALLFLEARLPAHAPVFVGNQRHDRLFVSCSMCYVLLRRPSPTPYHNLHPGLATTEAVQREIVARLETRGVDWVLLWDAPPGSTLEPRQAAGATLLDDHLTSRYERAARFGPWEIRRRTGIGQPADGPPKS